MERPSPRNPLTSAQLVSDRVPPATYHKQTVARGELGFTMSRSELMEFAWNPRRWRNGFERKATDSMDWGSLVDCLALTPDDFQTIYAVAPETYPSTPKAKGAVPENKEWTRRAAYCQDWETEQESLGKTVITAKDYNKAMKAVRALRDDPQFMELFLASKSQVLVTATYHDQDTGLIVPLKMLLDLVPDHEHTDFGDKLADLKTSETGHPRLWGKTIHNHNLHVQAALYMDAYNLATGEHRDTFLHVVQENYSPYDVSRRFLSQEYLELGRATYVAALKHYAACLDAQDWPGYPHTGINWNGWQICEPESWMLSTQ